MHRNLSEAVSVASTINPILGNNTTEGTGTAVDTKGYDSATAIFHFGISGDTLSGTVYVTPTLQESDTTTANDFTNVAAADLVGSLTVIDDAAEDPATMVVGYRGTKRYLRALVTFTGTHTAGIPISAVIVRGHPKVAPTS